MTSLAKLATTNEEVDNINDLTSNFFLVKARPIYQQIM